MTAHLTRDSFAARLPDRCAAISLKLGGPVVASPPRPKLSKASLSNVPSRPGAATKRPVPAKRPRSLQRVLSDERERRSLSRGPGRPISLMRSATAPVVPGLKREASEAPSLGSIPATEAPPLHANRGGLLNSKRFTQREVDMSSLAPKVNARKRTQVNIEAELKEAISALKKPNRELAGKVLAEIAEKRSASVTHSRSRFISAFARHGADIS
jgi:DNA replication regulator SLD3